MYDLCVTYVSPMCLPNLTRYYTDLIRKLHQIRFDKCINVSVHDGVDV